MSSKPFRNFLPGENGYDDRVRVPFAEEDEISRIGGGNWIDPGLYPYHLFACTIEELEEHEDEESRIYGVPPVPVLQPERYKLITPFHALLRSIPELSVIVRKYKLFEI